jgi:O-antigen/teichoic acid export membrane protein
MSAAASDRRELARGALIRGAGAVAGSLRTAIPIVFLRLFTAEAYGVFMVAYALVDVLQRAVVSGFSDALVFSAARHDGAAQAATGQARRSAERALARALATGFLCASVLSAIGVLALVSGARLIHSLAFDETQPVSLISTLRLMAFLLPLQVLVALSLAALQARLSVGYQFLIQSLLQPVAILAIAFAVRLDPASPLAPTLAWVGGTAIAAAAALIAFLRDFGVKPVLRALRTADLDRELIGYAVPQAANMVATFGRDRMTALIVAAFAAPAVVAHFTVASEVARLLRTLRMTVAAVFAALVARRFGAGDRESIQHGFELVSRWIAVGSLPVLLVLLTLSTEIFFIYNQPAPGAFFFVLVVATFLNTAYGASGTVLLMTGRVRPLLVINVCAAVVNLILGVLLVPVWGLLGAAIATAAAMAIQTVAQQMVASRLDVAQWPSDAWVAPLAGAMALAVGGLITLGLPLGVANGRLLPGPLSARIGVLMATMIVYALTVHLVLRRQSPAR